MNAINSFIAGMYVAAAVGGIAEVIRNWGKHEELSPWGKPYHNPFPHDPPEPTLKVRAVPPAARAAVSRNGCE